MIRPLTFLCASAFVFSGFHLYQTKHLAQVADRQIVQTMRDVAKAQSHAVLLRAEYALLNDPGRLQDLAQQYLAPLRPTAPPQFVAMADLASRLPPIGPAPGTTPPAAAPLDGPPAADIPIANATPPPAAAPVVVAEAATHPATLHPAAAHPAPAHPAAARTVAVRPAAVVVAANPPMDAVVRSVSMVRPAPRRSEPAATAPTPLHTAAVRQLPYVVPGRQAASPAAGYAQAAPVQAHYAPPNYSGTPFAEPRYAAPARPMGGSVLGMAHSMGGYPPGVGR